MRFTNLRLLFFTLLVLGSSKVIIAQDTTQGFKLFFEKVYVHTDRNFYNPSDNIWFKAYLVNAQTHQPISTSNNLYVELIDPTNAVVSRRVIRIDNGIGHGDFQLEDSIMAGAYRIRAYTNWMRNFGNHFVFEKEIEINNIPGVSKIPKNRKAASAAKSRLGLNGYNIQFLPESGEMVEGVPTKVAFKAEDANGNGVDVSGSIVSVKGDTAARFTSTYLGMGSFSFTPMPATQYTAFVEYSPVDVVKATFPAALPNGFVMNVASEDTEKVVLNIGCNQATIALHPTGQVTIAARHAGKSYFKQQLMLKDGKATVAIPKKDFPAGIANITLYDESMHPHCERLVYVENKNPLNITLSTNKTVYQSKENVTLNISVTDAQLHPVKADVSLAAVDVSMDKQSASNIATYLLLESELKGKIENASVYFDKNNMQRFQQLDLLLSTQGWRSFLWRQMADTSVRISYLPEPGVTVSGKVTSVYSNKPFPNYNITMFAPGAKGNKVFLTKTNAAGKYFLDGLPLYGNQTITLNAGNGLSSKPGAITMDTLFNNILPVTPYTYNAENAEDIKLVQEAARRRALISNVDSLHRLADVTVKTKVRNLRLADGVYQSFGYPEYDFTITPKDYTYKSLQWFLEQNVPGARGTADMDGVSFFSGGKEIRPRFIVDRSEDVFDRVDYYHLAMEQVETVSVRHFIGTPTNEYNIDSADFGNTGGIKDVFIIYLKIKPGAYNQQFSKISANINGYYEARTFYSPNYADVSTTRADVRNTIYWNPLITTDEEGKATVRFYNADPKTTIRVDLQGITDKGLPVTAETRYVVK